ncbi:Hpt domain-containing protein [Sphingomonas astaxanthinifaciens]|uniref:HPt domain-containing protein n=1 Tax=Sphingomonas astaxanthinifaciens DSM 22298 TaxID=1123267 RepID=A0ABQ5Z7A9_9SPHN|nr:Hpt domain-containing protein [Sphingomonas astaxanthinifaciens]GLR48685.1 hypothetical protein GCM10007925_24040 [Sphingomonas astaxanthinifaciens DSM 22298]
MDDPMGPLRERFRARAATHAEALDRAVAAQDEAALVALAHKLAGSAAIFGFAELGACASQIDEAAAAGGPTLDLPAVGQLLAGLRAIAHDAD